MQIYIIHGEYSSKSYDGLQQYLQKARKKGWKIVRFNDKSFLNVKELFSSEDLFAKKRIFLIDNLSKFPKNDLNWLKKNYKTLNGYLIFYLKNKASNTFLKSFSEVKKVEEFRLPKNIFDFLYSLHPGNCQKCVKLLHDLITNESVEFIFYLLSKHIRDLYWVKISPSDIPYPSWRVSRLESQASKFNKEQLGRLIKRLSEIDIEVKTSKAELIDSLDLLIIRQLE